MQIIMQSVPDEVPLPPVGIKLPFTVKAVEEKLTKETQKPMLCVACTIAVDGESWSPFTRTEYFVDPGSNMRTRVALKKLFAAIGVPTDGEIDSASLVGASGTLTLKEDKGQDGSPDRRIASFG